MVMKLNLFCASRFINFLSSTLRYARKHTWQDILVSVFLSVISHTSGLEYPTRLVFLTLEVL